MKLVLLGLCAAACAGRSYLGAQAPAACTSENPGRCAGWLSDQDLGAGELDVYDDAALRAYVQGIADRLATGSLLARPPHVTISDHDATYAPFGDRVVIGRITLERLGSEAEVAAVVAHELVHVEGHHATVSLFGPDADATWLATRRDAEGIADERAVALLERAGYAPGAMARALEAELDVDDDEHPPRGERIARAVALANRPVVGFEGRDELLRHEDHMIVGRDTRLGTRVGDAWVVASAGVALRIPARDVAHVDGDTLELHHDRATLSCYPVGEPWAKELAGRLSNREQIVTRFGLVTVGVAAEAPTDDVDPLAKLERVVAETLPQPPPGERVIVVDRCEPEGTCGGLVIELDVHGDTQTRNRWLAGLRVASRAELAAAEPARIALAIAPVTARVRDLVHECPDPAAALALDDADRVVAAGQPFKCTHRDGVH